MASSISSDIINGVHICSTSATNPSSSPIIFIHGGMHGCWAFKNYQEFFTSKGYNTYAFDWFNHGKSTCKEEEVFGKSSILDIVEEIKIVRAYTKSKDAPIIIAHSMGGLAAMQYATKEEVRALVLICPVVPKEAGATPIPAPMALDKPTCDIPPFEAAKFIFMSETSDADAHLYYKLLTRESSYRAKEAVDFSASVNTNLIKCPVYMIAAEKDVIVPCEAVEKLANMHKEWTFEKFPVGHGIPVAENWEPCAAKMNDWLAKQM